MKKITIAALVATALLSATQHALAQDLRAITEDGRKVLLMPDGKWRFDKNTRATPAGQSPFITRVKNFSVNFDENYWVLQTPKPEEDFNKRVFKHRALPLYAMVIADEIPLETASMRDTILSNARSSGASIVVLKERSLEYKEKDVRSVRFAVSMREGMEFVFETHYYGSDIGNIQVTCYTAQSLFFKYEPDCQKFLSGLSIQ
jgi:hypothetical protein